MPPVWGADAAAFPTMNSLSSEQLQCGQLVSVALVSIRNLLAMSLEGLIRNIVSCGTPIHSWKRYFQLFPERHQAWAQTPINVAANRRTHVGPIANLAQQLQQIGWQVTITRDQIMITTQWGAIDVLTNPTILTKQLFDQAWNAHIAQSIARKDYQPTTWDTQMQNNALKTRTTKERGILDPFMTGKNITSDMKAKYLDTYNGKCPMCDETDSKDHRLKKCKKLLRA